MIRRRANYRAIPITLCCAVLVLMLSACSSARVVSEFDVSRQANHRPGIIYVSDFDVQPDAISSESFFSRFPLHAMRERSQANSLIDVMGDSLVKELQKKGLEAHRLPPGAPLPNQGWLVRGAFLRIDEGNRVRRAVIGFGAGHTDLQVAARVDDLAAGKAPAPLYRMETAAESGKGPGAILTLNPYAAALKFVLSGRDLGEQTKKTASRIADEVLAHVNAVPQAPF